LIELLADGERSAYLRRALRDLEAQAKADKQTIADLEAFNRVQASELPSVEQVITAALNLNKTLQTDVAAGREQLRRLFKDGHIEMIPDGDCYIAKAQISPFAPLSIPTKPDPKIEQRETNDFALFRDGSGGLLRRLDHVQPIRICENVNNINSLHDRPNPRYRSQSGRKRRARKGTAKPADKPDATCNT
jgi:hypothetical protein